MKAELQKLIALQNLDTSIRKLETDQQAIPERRAEIEREFDQRASVVSLLSLFLVFVWWCPNSAKRLTSAIPLSLFIHSSKDLVFL